MGRTLKLIKEWTLSFAIAAIVVLIVNTFVAQAVKVPTPSMVPTVMVNDQLIIEKISRYTGGLKFGDIVVFNHNADNDGEERYLKRLIGLPGDTIEVKNGALYRNGEKVEEPYLNEHPINYTYGPITVPDEHYFFLGDNRNISHDSHRWQNAFVHHDQLLGRVFFRYFPLNRIGLVP